MGRNARSHTAPLQGRLARGPPNDGSDRAYRPQRSHFSHWSHRFSLLPPRPSPLPAEYRKTLALRSRRSVLLAQPKCPPRTANPCPTLPSTCAPGSASSVRLTRPAVSKPPWTRRAAHWDSKARCSCSSNGASCPAICPRVSSRLTTWPPSPTREPARRSSCRSTAAEAATKAPPPASRATRRQATARCASPMWAGPARNCCACTSSSSPTGHSSSSTRRSPCTAATSSSSSATISPCAVDGRSLSDLRAFLRLVPSWTACSNSDIMWAGASILAHHHYQVFPRWSLPVMQAPEDARNRVHRTGRRALRDARLPRRRDARAWRGGCRARGRRTHPHGLEGIRRPAKRPRMSQCTALTAGSRST